MYYMCLYCILSASKCECGFQGDWGSIQGRVIPKTQKMVIDVSLLNIPHYGMNQE